MGIEMDFWLLVLLPATVLGVVIVFTYLECRK